MCNEILDQSDLYRYGLDGGKFKKINRGREWHGPCPRCGDKDDLVVSNGMFWCRECGYGGALSSLLAEPLSDEEIEKAQAISAARKKQEEERQLKGRRANLHKLNEAKPWIVFHQNLLNEPDQLLSLEQDGIDLRAVEHFQLGYIPKFDYWVDGVRKRSPALTFPAFFGKTCQQIRCRILAEVEGDKYRPFMTDMGALYFKATFPRLRWVVIVEGEKKAINLWARGISAIGIWGCYTFKEEWIKTFRERYDLIYTALDPDPAGRKGAKRIQEMLGSIDIQLEGKPDDLLNEGKLTVEQLCELLAKSIFQRRKNHD